MFSFRNVSFLFKMRVFLSHVARREARSAFTDTAPSVATTRRVANKEIVLMMDLKKVGLGEREKERKKRM